MKIWKSASTTYKGSHYMINDVPYIQDLQTVHGNNL